MWGRRILSSLILEKVTGQKLKMHDTKGEEKGQGIWGNIGMMEGTTNA
jgi:hypothetical protein